MLVSGVFQPNVLRTVPIAVHIRPIGEAHSVKQTTLLGKKFLQNRLLF